MSLSAQSSRSSGAVNGKISNCFRVHNNFRFPIEEENIKKLLGCLIVVTILLQPLLAGAANYVLSNTSEISFDIVFEKNQFNFTVTKYIDPDTKNESLYMKVNNTKVESFTCEGHKIALANNIIDDGYIVTKDYGKMKMV